MEKAEATTFSPVTASKTVQKQLPPRNAENLDHPRVVLRKTTETAAEAALLPRLKFGNYFFEVDILTDRTAEYKPKYYKELQYRKHFTK